MDINYYRKINGVYGVSSKRESDLRNMKNQIAQSFDDDILSYPVEINGRFQSLSITYSSKEQENKIIAKPYETFTNGEVITWEDEKYLVVSTNPDKNIYTKGRMKRCVGELKWYDSDGDLHSRYFAMKSDPATNFGIEDGRVITVGNERRTIYLSFDVETKDLYKDKRFIFDSRAWKVSAIDTKTIIGLSIVTLQEDLINNENDNLDLEIADYNNRNIPETPIAIGDYQISITGVDKITKDKQATFESVVMVNGVRSYNETILWQLLNDDMITESSHTEFISQSSISATVKVDESVGSYFNLRAYLQDESDVQFIKRIQIKSLY